MPSARLSVCSFSLVLLYCCAMVLCSLFKDADQAQELSCTDLITRFHAQARLQVAVTGIPVAPEVERHTIAIYLPGGQRNGSKDVIRHTIRNAVHDGSDNRIGDSKHRSTVAWMTLVVERISVGG